MTERAIESVQSARCPVCQRTTYFTDSYDDFEAHHARFEKSEVVYNPGVDVGAWRPSVEVRIKGRVGHLARKDLTEFRVFPILCGGCHKMFVAFVSVVNVAEVRHYEEVVRPVTPPRFDKDEVLPKWGMQGTSVSDFVRAVKGIRNPMVRGAVIRKVRAAMEVRNASGKSVWDDVPAPPEPPQ